jgi:hypothetical protein
MMGHPRGTIVVDFILLYLIPVGFQQYLWVVGRVFLLKNFLS